MPPDAAAPVLDLAAYADISGRTWLGGEEALHRELTERGLASGDWATGHAHWAHAIDDEIARGGDELVVAFAARFDAARRTASSSVTLQAATSDAASDSGAPDLEPLAPVRQAVPTYLQARVPVAAPSADLRMSSPIDGVTEALDVAELRDNFAAKPTPFAGNTSAERLAELRASADVVARLAALGASTAPLPGTDETAMALPSAELRDRLALPFAPPPPGAPVGPRSALSASTEPLDLEHLRNLLVRGPTPFSGTTTPERLAEIKAESASSERVDPADELPGTEETAMYVPSALMRESLVALPFAAPPTPAIPELTVEGYASLAAQLQVHGATQGVLAQFEIRDADMLKALHAEQERRFAADPRRRAQFETARAHFVQAMKAQRR